MAPISIGEIGKIDAAHRHRAEWPQVVGEVPADYEAGRHEVPVEYRHPRTGQTVTVDVVVVNEPFLPKPGGPMTIAVDPANPDAVVVPGDGDPVREIILLPLFAVGVAAAAAIARWWSIRRTDRLITSGQTAFAMIAVLHPSGWRRGRARCSLYPLDGAAGTRPVCTFDALTTGGLPIAGPAFPVEVRGRPIPGGLLVARCGERIIRPDPPTALEARAAVPWFGRRRAADARADRQHRPRRHRSWRRSPAASGGSPRCAWPASCWRRRSPCPA